MAKISFIIPKDANFPQAYESAKQKGCKIKSRYTGVYACCSRTKYWYAESYSGKMTINLGRFPFTAEGEEQAAKAYQKFMKEKKPAL